MTRDDPNVFRTKLWIDPVSGFPSKGAVKWQELILGVRQVDPLRCPACQNPMRVIAVIDDPRFVEKILRHVGGWHDSPHRPPPRGAPGPYTCEPCHDVDPTPLCGVTHKDINVE